jgi:hypothetical protein
MQTKARPLFGLFREITPAEVAVSKTQKPMMPLKNCITGFN